ncbi:hypothetical protein EDD17DRAFT_1555632 [Pisolithus thermaeus]|nr:hypothetical protein EDD17DRAFT_1555632 [Pisolithus thermaeus]
MATSVISGWAALQPFSLTDAGIFISILMTSALGPPLPLWCWVWYVHWLGLAWVYSLAWSPFTHTHRLSVQYFNSLFPYSQTFIILPTGTMVQLQIKCPNV